MGANEVQVTGTITRSIGDTSAGSGADAHDPTEPNITCGKSVKFGFPGYGYWCFDTPDLPPNAKILSASFWVQWGSAKGGFAYDQEFRCLKRDGKWNEGGGFSLGDYPSGATLYAIPRHLQRRFMVAPSYSVGGTYEFTDNGTGDGSWKDMIQEAVNESGYAEDRNIGLVWNPNLCNAGDLWYPAAYDNATYASAELRITYVPRRVYVT